MPFRRNRLAVRPFLLAALLLAVAPGAPPLGAQESARESDRENAVNPVYTLDQDRLFNQSSFGARVLREIERRSGELQAENHRIEEELKAEEQALTDRRPELEPAEFRALADQFDAKVESIRSAQAQKSVDLNQWAEEERNRFFTAAYPVLLTLADEIGAAVVLDQRSTIITSAAADLTEEALARVDADLGDGTASGEQ